MFGRLALVGPQTRKLRRRLEFEPLSVVRSRGLRTYVTLLESCLVAFQTQVAVFSGRDGSIAGGICCVRERKVCATGDRVPGTFRSARDHAV